MELAAWNEYVYPASQNYVQGFTTMLDGSQLQGSSIPKAYSITILNGMGRVRATAKDHPASTGSYSGQYTFYDRMGRMIQQTNPTEINASWIPVGDDAYNSQTGWGLGAGASRRMTGRDAR